MQRLVVALTTLLGLTGIVVVAGYLFLFAAGTDRAARAAPADTVAYVTVYLQPSSGQKMNLANLLGRVPGFADAASLDQKIHEISARLLGDAGLDYEGDLRPWLGNQLALAIAPGTPDAVLQPRAVLLVAVRDPEAAGAALQRLAPGQSSTYEGEEIVSGADRAWALLDDLLVMGQDAAAVRAALNADAGRDASLSGQAGFAAAMRRLPADHLAAAYLDLSGIAAAAGAEEQLDGYSTASFALLAENEGLRVAGSAPFDADAASAAAREAFALASEPSSLAEWMPADTQAELVVFGLSQSFAAAEEQLGGRGSEPIADALNQLRAVAALGLGINVDDDLLPLFDRDAAIALGGLDGSSPDGLLLLRPSDPDAAQASLDRLRDALRDRGASVEETDVDGETITLLRVPDLGTVAFAVRDGVIVAGLGADQVGEALRARADGSSLAATDRYRTAWELAGTRGGNEAFVDVAAVVDATGDALGISGEVGDILREIGALAITTPARDDQSELHVVLTVR
ncbi:MAG: DUF3352 domain-containing protein [Candidatus Limnocylindria bacterium]